jgi:hypothetical protein
MTRSHLIWTDAMLAKLKHLRGEGKWLRICAEELGVPYDLVVMKARELGIHRRLNRGNVSAARIVERRTS